MTINFRCGGSFRDFRNSKFSSSLDGQLNYLFKSLQIHLLLKHISVIPPGNLRSSGHYKKKKKI